MCFLCICLFVLHVLVLSFFSWCRGLAAVSDCGTPSTFLLTFYIVTRRNALQAAVPLGHKLVFHSVDFISDLIVTKFIVHLNHNFFSFVTFRRIQLIS